MQWKNDLIKDIRVNNCNDDVDGPFDFLTHIPKTITQEFSECNHKALEESLLKCGEHLKYILEIGVCRNGSDSSTHTIIKTISKNPNSIYLGVDLEDKSFLNDTQKGIHTIKENSSNYNSVLSKLNSLGVNEIDYLLIDGWHSINQVLRDWEYTKILRRGGVVAFHDVTSHPGPFFFIKNLDKNIWEVFENLCVMDHGFGYAIKLY